MEGQGGLVEIGASAGHSRDRVVGLVAINHIKSLRQARAQQPLKSKSIVLRQRFFVNIFVFFKDFFCEPDCRSAMSDGCRGFDSQKMFTTEVPTQILRSRLIGVAHSVVEATGGQLAS